VEAVEKRINDHFSLVSASDPLFSKMRQEEFVDDTLAEWKPVYDQMWKDIQQFLPSDEAMQVLGGPMSRPFPVPRKMLQGQYVFSVTCDLRNLDQDWIDKKSQRLQQALMLDTTGQIDRTPIIRTALEDVDYNLADQALPQDQQKVTQAEIQDEQKACDLIIGSGQDQPLPQGANYQLRLQTLQAKQQSITQNPATMKIIQSNPDIIKVLLNRAQFFQRQLQQQQNAQIGRMQVSNTFNNQAPQPSADPSGMQMGQSSPVQLGY
jgi:hypothetical protein